MSVTLDRLLQAAPPGPEVVVTGDLARDVRWVHVSEVPDPSDFLEGGEVILTAGLWMDLGTPPDDFVRRLSGAGASAVGFGLSQLHGTVPTGLVAACRRQGLTLFRVPGDLPFLAIIAAFVDLASSEREMALRRAVRRSERFARASGSDDPVAAIVAALGCEALLRVWLCDPAGGGVIAHYGTPPGTREAEEALHRFAGADRWDGPGEIAPIAVGDRSNPDAILVARPRERAWGADVHAAIEQALPFLVSALARDRALLDVKRRSAAELIDLLDAGSHAAVAAQARLKTLGLSLDRSLAALVCRAPEQDRAVRVIERALGAAGLRGLVTTRDDEIAAIVESVCSDSDLRALANRAHAGLIESSVAAPAIAFGPPAETVEGLRKSLIQARHAAAITATRGGGCSSYAEVSSHMLLVALQDEDVVAHFRSAVLQPLIDHDARSQVSLVETLRAFLGSGGRWTETARELFIHVNTLRNRLQRVAELTGRDLRSMSDRVDFYVALEAEAMDEPPSPSGPDRRN